MAISSCAGAVHPNVEGIWELIFQALSLSVQRKADARCISSIQLFCLQHRIVLSFYWKRGKIYLSLGRSRASSPPMEVLTI